jgi:hypothetical protein
MVSLGECERIARWLVSSAQTAAWRATGHAGRHELLPREDGRAVAPGRPQKPDPNMVLLTSPDGGVIVYPPSEKLELASHWLRLFALIGPTWSAHSSSISCSC